MNVLDVFYDTKFFVIFFAYASISFRNNANVSNMW